MYYVLCSAIPDCTNIDQLGEGFKEAILV